MKKEKVSLSIRTMTPTDFEAADEILRPAFGFPDSRKDELRRYLSVQPDGWFLALADGIPAGTGGCVDFGEFAWIGLMGVHPSFQSRGLGRCVMQHILDFLRGKNVPMILLDASPAGKPLYESLGFQTEGFATLFEQTGKKSGDNSFINDVQILGVEPLEELAAFDRTIFGGDRRRVLEVFRRDFPGRLLVIRDGNGRFAGYLLAQKKRLGPWVALSPAAAERLLEAALSLPFDGPPQVILPEENPDAKDLLKRFGFTARRTNTHMRLGGQGLLTRRQHLYGQASFGIG